MSRQMFISAILLGLFAVFGTTLLLWVHAGTESRIAANELAALLARLNEVLPHEAYDNELQQDTTLAQSPGELGSDEPVTVYLGRINSEPSAAVISAIAPDGYSGKIKLLVGIYMDGRIAGVRVTAHKETPGLGDGIETSHSDWILSFNDKSLHNPIAAGWKVKKDGGEFDGLTGATITPRAVVRTVYKTLVYFEREKDNLFNHKPDITVTDQHE